MIKLFGYEMRRFLCNRFFVGLFLVTALFSAQVMGGDVILGVGNTAPFSPWSFGFYLSKILPLLLVALLFFLSFLSSPKERKVRLLTDATPVPPLRYRALQYGAITAAFLVISLVPVGYSWWFYGATFRFTGFGTLLFPLLCTLLPAFLFFLGLGALAGRLHPALVFALMPLALLAGFLHLPGPLDLYGSGLFSSYPLTLDVLDPPFVLPAAALAWKGVYSAAGAVMLLLATAERRPVR